MTELYRNGSFPMAPGAAACASILSANDDALLGTYAKSITQQPASEDVRALVAFNLAERYRLLAHARLEFIAAGRRAGLDFPHNYCRTAKCKYIQYGSEYVGVYHAAEFGSAFYSGLVTCGSVWACPVCTAKVQQRRRLEISAAIDWAHERGLQCVMVTLTFPHCSWHKLKKLLGQQRMALQRLRTGGSWRQFKKRFGYQYLIRGLGTYAKSITQQPASEDVRALVAFNLAERYRLLAHARLEFIAAGRRAGLDFPHNYCRTAKCKYIQYGSEYVGVYHAAEFGSAFYSGLVTCGSVWACPVCTAKVQQRRRLEISAAIDWAHERGLQCVMVTLTFPHCSWHKLKKLLGQQRMALQRLRTGGSWRQFKKRFGYQYLIRGLEVTYGENGWHPHVHELWFVDGDAEADEMRTEILRMWKSACLRAGLIAPGNHEAFEKHSVNVKGHCSNSEYLAKQDDSRHWGADREIASATTKAGKAKGLHPFGLLARAADGDRRAGRLFLAYALAMKGQRQLVWSPGLKQAVGVREISDESLADQKREPADLLGMLTSEEWRRVRSANKRAQILLAAEGGGWAAIQELIATLSVSDLQA